MSTHRRFTRRGHRSAVTHANIRQYTFSQDSTQLQQARHSVWRDNHVLTTTPTSQGTEPVEAGILHLPNPRTLTNKNRKRKRARPTSLSQSITSSVLSLMLDEEIATEEEVTGVYNDMYADEHTNETVTTPMYITTDAVYMYGWITDVTGSYPSRHKLCPYL